MRFLLVLVVGAALAITMAGGANAQEGRRMTQAELIQTVLQVTQPLEHPRGNRLPLYLWSTMGPGTTDDAETEKIIRSLDARGIALLASWNPRNRDATLAEGLRIGAIQKRLGLPAHINANACLYSFFNGDERTAHVTESGEPFFDSSFGERYKMGCPFALEHRVPAMREQVEFFVRAYKERDIEIAFAFADWEIDGPIEWNGAWDASKRCARCRKEIPRIDDFHSFQTTLRKIRADLQRRVFAEPVKQAFPKALVGNYAVYPNNGKRYWYDYFELEPGEGIPYEMDQKAKVRPWFADEFRLSGYSFAMPVVYTWYRIFHWYDFENTDYRWFYNMLQVGSNAGEHTPAEVPIITFVHWHTTALPKDAEPVKQFSEEKYQELLWHLLLRGHDTFFSWCPRAETAVEVRLLHQVWAAALEYRDFLDRGTPVTFHVPPKPGPVVSGLRLGNRVLVRRTEFDDTPGPVSLKIDGKTLAVPRAPGRCQVLTLR